MNPCDQINAMLVTQRALQAQLTDDLLDTEVALGVATKRLREANENHVKKLGDFNTATEKLRMANQVLEQLSMIHTQMQCN